MLYFKILMIFIEIIFIGTNSTPLIFVGFFLLISNKIN